MTRRRGQRRGCRQSPWPPPLAWFGNLPLTQRQMIAVAGALANLVIPAARTLGSSVDCRAAGISLISRAAATPTLRAYQSALRAAGISTSLLLAETRTAAFSDERRQTAAELRLFSIRSCPHIVGAKRQSASILL